ncbi:MAG: hypothetical protein IJW82_02145 [Clostridia bacterium]|nr:hypothetical protein [Clostridia bacterium]
MNKKFKFFLVSVFVLFLCFFTYETIGYFFMGYNSPRIYGDTKSMFLGNYFLAIVYGLLSILSIVVILILIFKIKKKK